MEARETSGQAYRGGRLVAGDVLLLERHQARRVAAPATAGLSAFRRKVVRHPSGVWFNSIEDEQLYRELQELIAGACDPDRARHQRDSAWAPKPIDLVLEYERALTGCVLRRPFESVLVRPEATEFPIGHPEL